MVLLQNLSLLGITHTIFSNGPTPDFEGSYFQDFCRKRISKTPILLGKNIFFSELFSGQFGPPKKIGANLARREGRGGGLKGGLAIQFFCPYKS